MNFFAVFADKAIIYLGTESSKACEVFNRLLTKTKSLEIILNLVELESKFKAFVALEEDEKLLEEDTFNLKKEWVDFITNVKDQITKHAFKKS